MNFLSSIGAKIGAGAVVVLLIAGLFFYARAAVAERDLARAQVGQLQQVNLQNVAALTKLQSDFVKAQAAAAAKAQENQQRQDQLASIEKENAHAPNGDRPVCPVVGRVLGELLAPAASTGADQGSPNAGPR